MSLGEKELDKLRKRHFTLITYSILQFHIFACTIDLCNACGRASNLFKGHTLPRHLWHINRTKKVDEV